MTTTSVSFTVPSNGWTGSINVSDCNLDTDISVEDYEIFYDGVEQGAGELSNWSKVSSTSLSYSGSSLNINDLVVIRRHTPDGVITTVQPLETISSSQWNAEFDRCARRDEELRLYGTAVTDAVTISDEAFGTGWNGITTQAPSKNAVYDAIDDTAYNATTWNGDIKAPTKNAIRDKIETLTNGESSALVSDTAYATSWNGVTTIAPSKNTVFDAIEEHRFFGNISGRLTITSNTPVLTSNASGTTIYFTPFNGNLVYTYDTSGTRWVRHTLSEVSLALGTLTNDIPYDIFLYSNAGTLTLEKLAWTNRTTRATALAFQDGVLVKSGDASRRYLGTVASPGSNTVYQGNYTITTNASFHETVWNYYNQVPYSIVQTYYNAPSGTGAYNLYNTNVFGRVMLGYAGAITISYSQAVTNATGGTNGLALSVYEDFSAAATATSGSSSIAGATNFHCCASINITATALNSYSPRMSVSSVAGSGWGSIGTYHSTVVWC